MFASFDPLNGNLREEVALCCDYDFDYDYDNDSRSATASLTTREAHTYPQQKNRRQESCSCLSASIEDPDVFPEGAGLQLRFECIKKFLLA